MYLNVGVYTCLPPQDLERNSVRQQSKQQNAKQSSTLKIKPMDRDHDSWKFLNELQKQNGDFGSENCFAIDEEYNNYPMNSQ
uniref:Uncharacterized protein n=1 Tax=Romanomermis culicivorax TaxID=13658 RepID=A0A915KTN5_ROMCU